MALKQAGSNTSLLYGLFGLLVGAGLVYVIGAGAGKGGRFAGSVNVLTSPAKYAGYVDVAVTTAHTGTSLVIIDCYQNDERVMSSGASRAKGTIWTGSIDKTFSLGPLGPTELWPTPSQADCLVKLININNGHEKIAAQQSFIAYP